MEPIRFALVGGGWRAEFYARIAKEMPERFTLTGALLRDHAKRAAWAERFGGRTAATLDELLLDKPEFLVLSVAKAASTPLLLELIEKGVPVLCETPPAVEPEGLTRVWNAARKAAAPVQVAEQYPYQPLYSTWQRVIDLGLLGEVSNMSLSALHGYHAVCIMRRMLGVGFENARLTGERFFFPVRKTDSREGVVIDGEVQPERRDRVTFAFEGGKVAFFDFSPVQYNSFIRERHIAVQGTQGEIDDLVVRRIGEGGLPLTERLERRDLGVNNNNHWSHFGLTLGERCMYLNPFCYARLNDDELAVADCVARMGALCRGEGGAVYPMREALQDAYFAWAMEQALTHPNQPFETISQEWKA